MIKEATQALRQKQTVNPKTTLGFYATIAISVATLSVIMAIALATSNVVTWLIPWILGVGVGQALLVAGGVFYINVSNPQNLMLGEITGSEFAEIRRVAVYGDSSNGERRVALDKNDGRIEVIEADSIAREESHSNSRVKPSSTSAPIVPEDGAPR